jgi:hypothetical protein
MPLVSHVAALLEALKTPDLEALPPAERRRFADLCHHLALVAERPDAPSKAGVLTQLQRGERGA